MDGLMAELMDEFTVELMDEQATAELARLWGGCSGIFGQNCREAVVEFLEIAGAAPTMIF